MCTSGRSYGYRLLAPALLLFLTAIPAYGESIIFQSATLGPIGQFSGTTISPSQFLGARFSLSQPVAVRQIGGHLGIIDDRSIGPFFGAILALNSPTTVPAGNPFAPSEVVATTTFNLPFTTADILTPLAAALEAGNYALVFGAGEFGSPATAVGVMPNDNTDLPGESYLFWDGSRWRDDEISKLRFVVAGTVVPEPTCLLLTGAGLGALAGIAWRRRCCK